MLFEVVQEQVLHLLAQEQQDLRLAPQLQAQSHWLER